MFDSLHHQHVFVIFWIPVFSVFVSQVGKGDEEDEDNQANGQLHLKPGLSIMLTGSLVIMITMTMVML